MAQNQQNVEGANSGTEELSSDIRSIAATLLKPAEAPKEPDEEEIVDADPEPDGDDDADDQSSETSSEEGEDPDEEETVPDSGIDDDEEEDDSSDESDSDQDEDDEAEYLTVQDEDLITVIVDDEEQEVSIGDLKRNFSLGQASEQRLQEATEARKEAHAERTKALEDYAAQTAIYDSVFEGLDETLYKGVIPAPSEELRKSNPEQYLRHKEAYDQEQSAIADAKKQLEDKRKEAQDKRQAALDEYAEQAAKVIAQHIPELADSKTSQQAFSNMASMAQAYGYTAKEINSALDPRMFLIMRDLVKYHELVNTTKGRDIVANKGQKQKKVRRLRSGNTNAKQRARQADKQRQNAADTARKTGKVSDIAATLVVPAPRK